MESPRRNDLEYLDPEFRARLRVLEHDLTVEGIPLRRFETIRSPERQNALYARGRDPNAEDFGRTVTKAHAYQSGHQHGGAADYVFWAGKWTWDEPAHGLWKLFGQLAAKHGLRQLSFEKPHVELPKDWKSLPVGPADSVGWLNWLMRRNAELNS